ncbi:hypothetical protein T05_12182, partial [Trichinella murrelli]
LPPSAELLGRNESSSLERGLPETSLHCRDKGSLEVANDSLRLKDNP